MRVFVTGSEGFVGKNLVEALLARGDIVVHWDYVLPDCVDPIEDALVDCDAVIHLAANADVRNGWDKPQRDLYANTMATSTLLEAMRKVRVERLLFASSSSVYGNAPTPTREDYFGRQTSLYGASKLACEGLIGAYVEAGFLTATVLRLTSMLGKGYRHGLVKDFYESFKVSPELKVLGNGFIERTRMDVSDGVAAFTHHLDCTNKWEVFNVGTDETINALEVASQVAKCMDVDADITVTGKSWAGDHPILLDCSSLRSTGWEPKYTIEQGITRTVDYLEENNVEAR